MKKYMKEESVRRNISKWLEEPIKSEYILRIFFLRGWGEHKEDEPILQKNF